MSFSAKHFRLPAIQSPLCVEKGLSLLLLLLPAAMVGRLMKDWTFEEMFSKSDVVVIATPIATFETGERTALKDIAPPVEVLGLSTEFQVRLVLKGDKVMKKVTLHHYRLEHEEPMISEPELISFDPKLWGPPFLLFLIKERDERYAPVTGQTDPALYSVIQLKTDAK